MRVVIVGAGVSGLTLAAFLRRLNISCVVIERLPDLDSVYQPPVTLWSNALNCYSAFDIGGVLRYEDSTPETYFGVRQARTNKWLLRMKNRAVQHEAMDEGDLVPSAVAPTSTSESLVSRVVLDEIKKELADVPLRHTISARKLKGALREYVDDVRFGRAVVDLAPSSRAHQGVDVVLDNGHVESADVVVGADGLYSSVRRLVYPYQVEAHTPLSQNVTQIDGFVRVADFPASLGAHPAELWGNRKTVSYFPVTDATPLRDRMERPLSRTEYQQKQNEKVDRGDGTSVNPDLRKKYIGFSATLYNSPEDVTTLGSITSVEEMTKSCRALLDREFADFGDDVRAFMRTAEHATTAELLEVPIMPQWHNRRAVLMGDAAHGALPSLLSQDASLCVEDAAVLATTLANVPLDRDSGYTYAFRSYEKARRARVEQFIRQSRRTRGLACSQNPALRDVMLRCVPPMVATRSAHWLSGWSYRSKSLLFDPVE
jgi:2-polyprenyl-6-methoxyphenol hydroxylase-like FAD-dependent oxidoreductase